MDDNYSALPPEVQFPSVSDVVEPAAQQVTEEQLAQLVAALKSAQPTSFKKRLQGLAGSAKPKVSKHWYNGELLDKVDFDKLSWEEVHASNNVIRK